MTDNSAQKGAPTIIARTMLCSHYTGLQGVISEYLNIAVDKYSQGVLSVAILKPEAPKPHPGAILLSRQPPLSNWTRTSLQRSSPYIPTTVVLRIDDTWGCFPRLQSTYIALSHSWPCKQDGTIQYSGYGR